MKINMKKVRTAVQGSGYKKKYIAEKSGMTPNMFAQTLAEKRKFKADEFVAFCGLLGVKPDDLVD